ncbi:GtrA family protein [Mesorhizobium sp. AR07]|uniref:GtrA family protein n=1 Tax=Mesorhizobium sp. AR07 TaxID=2865838 RepID=UPI00215EBA6D|nr:GtrA family protein [Mesorhizobium sp. AR07]UVK45695.1 GtrA family protein [Mesorhizobium sp. AR07]
MINRQIGWFAIAGVVGFAADAGVLYLLLAYGLGPFVSRFFSFLAAVFVTWQLNRHKTFPTRSDEPLWREGLRYLTAMMFGGAANYAVYCAFVMAGWLPILGLVAGTGAGTVLNFLSARSWVFRDRSPSARRGSFRSWIGGALTHPGAAARAMWLAPLLGGLIALLRGQDSNWDLLNYHFYNPYALLGGRIGIDLAAAQFQSYFNPLLDMPYYAMVAYAPAMVAGFVMGAFHGLNFVLLLCIVRLVLGSSGKPNDATSILLSLAGCMGPAFLSELGNTMGDTTTAVFVLCALALIVWQLRPVVEAGWPGVISAAAGGLLMGAGVGLKLTNAVYAVALCLALLSLPAPWLRRPVLAFGFGVGVLAGVAATSGYWFATLLQAFGNPLFPQFNAWFGAPLAAPITVVDARWLPKSIWEALLFPFAMVINDHRVGELPMRPFVWPVLWLLMVLWIGSVAMRKSTLILSAPERLVVLFVSLAFVVWMAIFSIYRYAVPMEMLAPLAVWIVVHKLLSGDMAKRVAAVTLALVATYAVVDSRSWGHEAWDTRAFRVVVPDLPVSGTLLLIAEEVPNGWMVPFFPPKMAAVGLGTNFPEGPAYTPRVREIVEQTGGKAWAVMPAHIDEYAARVAQVNGILEPLKLSMSGWPCRKLSALLLRVSKHLRVDEASNPGSCRLVSSPAGGMSLAEADLGTIRRSGTIITRYGLTLDAASCRTYEASVGAAPRPYQLCKVGL